MRGLRGVGGGADPGLQVAAGVTEDVQGVPRLDWAWQRERGGAQRLAGQPVQPGGGLAGLAGRGGRSGQPAAAVGQHVAALREKRSLLLPVALRISKEPALAPMTVVSTLR